MTSLIAAGGAGRSTSVIPAVPAASSITTIALMGIADENSPSSVPADCCTSVGVPAPGIAQPTLVWISQPLALPSSATAKPPFPAICGDLQPSRRRPRWEPAANEQPISVAPTKFLHVPGGLVHVPGGLEHGHALDSTFVLAKVLP